MSFILDALRKVDRETRDAEEAAPPVAAFEKRRIEQRSRRRQFAAMAVIGALSALATTLLLRRAPTRTPAVDAPPVPSVAEAAVETPSVEPETVEAPPVVVDTAEDETPQETPPPTGEDASVDVATAEPAPAPDTPDPEPAASAPEPPVAEPEAPELPELVLQGTSVLAGKSVAVVSDRRVFVGDFIEGALVVRIEERLVELEFGGRRFTLTF